MSELDPYQFYSATGLSCVTTLELTKLKLELVNNINITLMAEKEIRAGICHSVYLRQSKQ